MKVDFDEFKATLNVSGTNDTNNNQHSTGLVSLQEVTEWQTK